MASSGQDRVTGLAAMLGGLGWAALLPLSACGVLGPDPAAYALLARLLLAPLVVAAVGLARCLAAENDWAHSLALRVALGGLGLTVAAFQAYTAWHMSGLVLVGLLLFPIGLAGLLVLFWNLRWPDEFGGWGEFCTVLLVGILGGLLKWAGDGFGFDEAQAVRLAAGGLAWAILGHTLWAAGRPVAAEAAGRSVAR